ncbi:MAG: hypothetical protein IJD92_00930 [Bacilli bacterium]|nr:hypothetical protein [Bacilli bacterium]MBQ3511815.1 hypothetical protein [Bacilli bacterium]
MISTEERYSKLRRQKINVMLNEEERRIITEKAIKYGFGDCLAEYIRAACIYENIYIEDVEGKQEICKIISKFIETLREILKEQKKILNNYMIDKADIEIISNQNIIIIKMISKLSNLLISILSVNTEKKIQQRLGMIEKYKIDENFYKKIINNNYQHFIVRPSNLNRPNQKPVYIVYLNNHTYTYSLDDINQEDLIQKINNCRDVAMQKDLLISFYREGSILNFGIIMEFQDKTAAKEFASEINSQFFSLEGDAYTNNS